jgi:DNA relaxase NicK
MDRLKTALERLDVAIDHLDTAFSRREAHHRAERDELLRALAAAQAAEAEAKATAEAVSARLDTAIDRLQTVLED